MSHWRLRKDAVADEWNKDGYDTLVNDQDSVIIPGVQAVINTSIFNEIPTGPVDGSNQIFTLTHLQQGEAIQLFKNGLLQEPFADYTVAGNEITFVTAPRAGSRLQATYSF